MKTQLLTKDTEIEFTEVEGVFCGEPTGHPTLVYLRNEGNELREVRIRDYRWLIPGGDDRIIGPLLYDDDLIEVVGVGNKIMAALVFVERAV